MDKKTFVVVSGIIFLLMGLCTAMTEQSWAIEAATVNKLAAKIHTDFRSLVMVQKIQVANAVNQQRQFLLQQADVREVLQLRGNNLFVRFKDGNELLMLLGVDRLGTGAENDAAIKLAQMPVQPQPLKQIHPELQRIDPKIFQLMPCATNSNKALIFDCLEDDYNVVNPKIWMQVKADLEAMGYTVTTLLNNSANLANAALIDDGEYGIVFMRGHGGDLGGDFGFLVRPWYASYPPANSGYTGTIRASAYNHAANATQFGYIITGQFSSTYWVNKPFPRTAFFLESCHGTDPGALPGMPTWTTNHGAIAWLGWNESVSFNCGDNGSKLFFQKMLEGKTAGEAVAAVYATGCRPPELTIFPSGKEACKFTTWKSDPNEGTVGDARDFRLVGLLSDRAHLHASITFYAVPTFDEFFFYADTGGTAGADVLVRCHPTNFEVYKQTSPGLYNNKVFTGTPTKSGNTYSLAIPWDVSFGAVPSVKIWLYDMTGKDRLPDAGNVTVIR